MNKLIRSNRIRLRMITLLATLCLLQFQTTSRADYTVQLGAFADQARADRLVKELQQQGLPATAYTNDTGNRPLTSILVGPYPDQATAEHMRKRLDVMDIPGFLANDPSSSITGAGSPELQVTASSNEAAAQELPDDPGSFDDLFMPVPAPDELETQDGTTGETENIPGEGWVTEYNNDGSKFNFRGFLNSKLAYTYPSPGHLSMFRNTLELETSGRVNSNISWKLSARGVYDAVFNINDFYSDRVKDNRQLEGALHETYLDISSGDLDFRLGRQNIVWGEMVGLFFADVVSAKDTRQFVAEDFDLIRIPQWAVRAEHFKGDFHSEIIWIPYMTYNEIGEPGDDFYPLGTEPLPGDPIIENDNQPAQKLSNSAFGLRLSMLKAGWDVSGFYYHSVDAAPFFSSSIKNGQAIITPEHDKIDQVGFTLAKDFGLMLLKSEAIYTKDRWFNVEDTNNLTGLVQQDTFDYVIGLEYTTPDNTLLNFQFYQRWYTDYDSDILFDEFESGVGLFTRIELSNKVEAELLLLSQLNRTDWMARPKVSWDVGNNWLLQVGVDIFGGDNTIGVFGRFDDSDRVYGNARYTF